MPGVRGGEIAGQHPCPHTTDRIGLERGDCATDPEGAGIAFGGKLGELQTFEAAQLRPGQSVDVRVKSIGVPFAARGGEVLGH
ncbi:Uncharacterised protein [Mycobacteroides abscessus subsp. massiliense]|uniref:Uncharacterized protein n=1 Tax=Mycobacteroides abscessus subsp. massiliense TaxID=1962118 RepID=A0A1T8VX68_9MYCO|nr:Uncharacterised protein [Mycobacteroides abscessus subsp. massiliense]